MNHTDKAGYRKQNVLFEYNLIPWSYSKGIKHYKYTNMSNEGCDKEKYIKGKPNDSGIFYIFPPCTWKQRCNLCIW